MIITTNFVVTSSREGNYLIDKKNNIKCFDPTMDLLMYVQYMALLNGVRNEWKVHTYFDMGMMPIVYLPSFAPDGLKQLILKTVASLKLKTYELPSISLLQGNSMGFMPQDVWAYRKDVAQILGESDIFAVTTFDLLRKGLKF